MRIFLCNIFTLAALLLPQNSGSQPAKDNYSASSVLASGQWFKMAVLKEGIYRLDYSKLKQLGLNNLSNPRIFANNSGQLSYYNDNTSPDDLKEVAVMVNTGSDGVFNEGDYLLFYAKSATRWKFNPVAKQYTYVRHNYSDTAFYFLTTSASPGAQVRESQAPSGSPDYFTSQTDLLYAHEQDNENLIKSGREWYQKVSPATGVAVNPGFSGLVPGEKILIRLRVAARASVITQFRLYEGETLQKSSQVQPVNLYAYTGAYAQATDSVSAVTPLSSAPQYTIRFFNNGESGALGWLDFFLLQARAQCIYNGGMMVMSDKKTVAPGRVTEFTVKSASENPVIWDVTDPFAPVKISWTRSGENLKFRAATSDLRNFILFSEASVLQPVIKGSPVPAQNLHGSSPADMIIVTYPAFRKYAEKIAEMHSVREGLISLITTPEEIYNEFSGGIPDIAAIRNFVRMKYRKQAGTDHPLKYLLLFGDGSYENRTPPPRNPNFIPTYQSQNSLVVVSSFTSDDFYGLLEDNEGEADGTEDIGIGRMPVSDTTQAGIVVRKIIRYADPRNKGDWKNIICLTADDEDGNSHMSDAEGLYSLLKDSAPEYNVSKIYLDAFRQVSNVSGQTYPDAVKAINDRINSGCLIFNYIGHGSENGLAAEGVIKPENIASWKNGSRLPLFITATCEFSRFDDVKLDIISGIWQPKTSAGEQVLLNESGGAIALMSTTRLVFSAPNYFLNKNIYACAFRRDANGNPLTLGEIIRIAKNNSGDGPNKRNFSLLGDPALRLEYPWHGNVVTDSVNKIPAGAGTDSLKALSMVTITGHIEGFDKKPLTNFNGTVTPVVYDKVSSVRTLANDGGLPMKFELRNNILFSGKTTVRNGRFSFTFIVPRDIDYSFGPGLLSYYAYNDTSDMNGSYSGIIVGGFASASVSDTRGPEIRLFLNDTLFRDGGMTDNNPILLALLRDDGGINTSGAGIGHDLVAFLDNDRNRSILLNDYFENDFDDFSSGRLIYDLTDLKDGAHSITLKAWDNFNNSSEETVTFIVEKEGKFVLKNLMNYPNPVLNATRITAEHNRPFEQVEVKVEILDMSGRMVRIIDETGYTSGYQLSDIVWDGNDEGGKRVARGIYAYRIRVRTINGENAEASGRIIIL